mgnify:CR=1 FL=1
MEINRIFQRHLLEKMNEAYPYGIYFDPPDDEAQRYAAALNYLDEHGLCRSGGRINMDRSIAFNASTITAAGIDFLADDGGLSAILGVVTVKLHADTIRDLIAAKIDTADIPDERKSVLKKHLASLPGTVLTAATQYLAKIGIDHVPDAIHWLETLGGA